MLEFLRGRRQLLWFLIGGGASALIDVGLMQLLIIKDVDYVIATSAGFAAGLAFNFTFHARYTFASAMSGAAFLRYLCVVGLNYLITLACVSASMETIGTALAGKIVSLFIVPISGFLFGKYWIFK